jgi:CheY-like chemotaxis protein
MLAFMGVQHCEWKSSGWQVVQFADTLPRVDLVLMDIRLPYEDGLQALQKIRAHDRLKDTLVVAVTAREASEEQLRKAQQAASTGSWASRSIPTVSRIRCAASCPASRLGMALIARPRSRLIPTPHTRSALDRESPPSRRLADILLAGHRSPQQRLRRYRRRAIQA